MSSETVALSIPTGGIPTLQQQEKELQQQRKHTIAVSDNNDPPSKRICHGHDSLTVEGMDSDMINHNSRPIATAISTNFDSQSMTLSAHYVPVTVLDTSADKRVSSSGASDRCCTSNGSINDNNAMNNDIHHNRISLSPLPLRKPTSTSIEEQCVSIAQQHQPITPLISRPPPVQQQSVTLSYSCENTISKSVSTRADEQQGLCKASTDTTSDADSDVIISDVEIIRRDGTTFVIRYVQLFVVPIVVIYTSWLLCCYSLQAPNYSNSFVLLQQQQQQQQNPWNSHSQSWRNSIFIQDTEIEISSTITTTKTFILPNTTISSPLTLRDILYDTKIGFHLAMAPAFFGFYGYFGILSAWYEEAKHFHNNKHHDETRSKTNTNKSNDVNKVTNWSILPIRSVVGASAGAIAAILIAADISPTDAMNFCKNITLDQYADFPGLLSLFRGNKFERIMSDFLIAQKQKYNGKNNNVVPKIVLQMEDSYIPVAVTAFDIQTMSTQILMSGSMARAARASATFPGLFQPVGWYSPIKNNTNSGTVRGRNDYLLIDGGVMDTAGTIGLSKTMFSSSLTVNKQPYQRVIHLCIGSCPSLPKPSSLPGNPALISISIIGLPQPGPWAMSNGPIAYEMARKAMLSILDLPLEHMNDKNDVKESKDTTKTQHQRKHQKLLDNSCPHYQIVINVK